MDLKNRRNEEYIGIKTDILSGVSHILIFKRVNGVISDQKKYYYELIGDNNFSTFLLQYYTTSPQIPYKIYVNEIPESKRTLEVALEKLSNHRVKIIKVTYSVNNEKKDLMNLILKNLSIQIEGKYNQSVIELKNTLNLKEFPFIIDCFDVSNFGTSFAVGACVRFVNGYPYKNGYRRFKIKSLQSKQDDYSMIKEIVHRKYMLHKSSIDAEKINNDYNNINSYINNIIIK